MSNQPLSTGLPAFSHPWMPADMMKTFLYPYPTAARAAWWQAIQCVLAQ